jgi:hypothetical protein
MGQPCNPSTTIRPLAPLQVLPMHIQRGGCQTGRGSHLNYQVILLLYSYIFFTFPAEEKTRCLTRLFSVLMIAERE